MHIYGSNSGIALASSTVWVSHEAAIKLSARIGSIIGALNWGRIYFFIHMPLVDFIPFCLLKWGPEILEGC